MFSKSLRLPLFGLLGMALLASGAFFIFSSDEDPAPTSETIAETQESDANDQFNDGEDEAVRFTRQDGDFVENPLPLNEETPASTSEEPDDPISIAPATNLPTKTEPTFVKGQVVEYKIQPGDMVSKIAYKFGCKSSDIYRLNDRINAKNASKIRSGWTIQVVDNKGVGGKSVVSAKPATSENPKVEPSATPKEVINGPKEIKRDPPVIPAAPDIDTVRTHVFKQNETSISISKKYYGTPLHWRLISDANPHWNMLDSPSGTILKIPALSTGKNAVLSNKGLRSSKR